MNKQINSANETDEEADIFKMKFLRIRQARKRFNLGEGSIREIADAGGAAYKYKTVLLINAEKFEKEMENYALAPGQLLE